MVGQRSSFCLLFPHTKNKNKTLLSALSNTYPLLMHFVYVPKIYSMEQYKNGFVSSFFFPILFTALSVNTSDWYYIFFPHNAFVDIEEELLTHLFTHHWALFFFFILFNKNVNLGKEMYKYLKIFPIFFSKSLSCHL